MVEGSAYSSGIKTTAEPGAIHKIDAISKSP